MQTEWHPRHLSNFVKEIIQFGLVRLCFSLNLPWNMYLDCLVHSHLARWYCRRPASCCLCGIFQVVQGPQNPSLGAIKVCIKLFGDQLHGGKDMLLQPRQQGTVLQQVPWVHIFC